MAKVAQLGIILGLEAGAAVNIFEATARKGFLEGDPQPDNRKPCPCFRQLYIHSSHFPAFSFNDCKSARVAKKMPNRTRRPH
jgi:hypothetical protein